MSDIASNTSAHADLRSASRSYNRDKNHTTKWSLGPRTALNQPALDSAWSANAPATNNAKIVPLKWSGRSGGPPKSHANVSTKARGVSHYDTESANLRVNRKQDALREITYPDSKSLSRSLADLLPSTSTSIPINKNEAADAGVLYSFDKKSSPSDTVGLGGLIERAEQRFREKETIKLVKSEYEVLDSDGEKEVLRKGRKDRSGGGSAMVMTAGAFDEDDDYELV